MTNDDGTVEIALNTDLDICMRMKKLIELFEAPIPLHVLEGIVSQVVSADPAKRTIKRLTDKHLILPVTYGKDIMNSYILDPAVELGYHMAKLELLQQ